MDKTTAKNILKMVEGADAPLFNDIRNSITADGRVRTVSIPVTLYNEDKIQLQASVNIMSSSMSLFAPALSLVLDECKNQKINIEWDSVSFTANKKFRRDEVKATDSFSSDIIKYKDRNISEIIDEILSSAKSKSLDYTKLPQLIYSAVIAQTIDVKIETSPSPTKQKTYKPSL